MEKDSEGDSARSGMTARLRDLGLLMKFTLSFTVVFSSVVSYLLVPSVTFDITSVLLLFTAGMLVTGSANAINQIVEKDSVLRSGRWHPAGWGSMRHGPMRPWPASSGSA
jgi:protoheme IX farnesyltransferase